MIVSRKSLLKRGTAMFFPGARKCKYSAILISEGMLYTNEMSQEKDTTCPEAGVKFRKEKKQSCEHVDFQALRKIRWLRMRILKRRRC